VVNRQKVKRDAILFRIYKYGSFDFYGHCPCDLCRTMAGVEMHEIYSRGRTEKQEEAREASYQEELVSLLCPTCHKNYAHTEEGRAKLIQRNVETYGRKRVEQAADRLPRPQFILQYL
jgi:hypothetical protein